MDRLLAGLGREGGRDTLRLWCGGYRFGHHADIHSPGGVMERLADAQDQGGPGGQPDAHRTDSTAGEISPLPVRHLRLEDGRVREGIARLLARQSIRAGLTPGMRFPDCLRNRRGLWTLLYLAGLLTEVPRPEPTGRDDTDEDDIPDNLDFGDTAFLALPNLEARRTLLAAIEAAFQGLENAGAGREALREAMPTGDVH